MTIQAHAAKVAASLHQAGALASKLRMPAETPDRYVISWALLRMSYDHAASIVSLIHHHGAELAGSAFALTRIMDEAQLRGAWFALHASDDDAKFFLTKDAFPKTSAGRRRTVEDLIGEIEQHEPFDRMKPYSKLYENAWKKLNSFTHSGAQQVGAYTQAAGLGASFKEEDIHALLDHAEAMAINAVLVMTLLVEDEQLRSFSQELEALVAIPRAY